MTHRNSSWNAPYTFSDKEKDVETGYGYFGARYYDSGLSIWLSVDPMSDKYPSMSPYNYCGNNPIMMVDPDGERIIIVLPNLRLEFKNGKLYNTTDNNLYSGDNQFARSIENGLNQIKNNSLLGSVIVSVAEHSDKELRIQSTEGNPKVTPHAISTTEFDFLTMEINPQGYVGFVKVDNYLGYSEREDYDMVGDLAHELSHAFDFFMGFNTEIFTRSVDGVAGNEWLACFRENIIRKDLGKNLRTRYKKTYETNTGNLTPSGPRLLDERGNPKTTFLE